METEEEDNSKLCLPLENDSTMTSNSPISTTQTPNELQYSDPQCGTHTDPEICEPQPGAGYVESQFLPPESETKLPDTLNYQDVLAAENTAPLDASEFEVGGGGGEYHSPPSQTPQPAVAESVEAEAETAPVEGETTEILQEVPGKDENDGDLIPREGGPEASGSSDSPDNKENDGDVNDEIEVAKANRGSETKTDVVADVAENSAKEEVTCLTEEPATADEVEKSMEKPDGSKPEAAHVAEGPEIADMAENMAELKENNEGEAEVKENNEGEAELNEYNVEGTEVKVQNVEETEVEEEKEETREEYVLVEEMEVAEQMKIGDIVEETKTSDEVAEETNERDEMEVGETMEEQDKEELDAANAGEELEMAEEADETEEAENAEDVELADGNEVAEEESNRSAGGKRKRGKNTKAPARTSRKKAEEDVCFICFDGGDLVLCDRRGCPKAYHPTCVNRDDAFFRARGRWNCGFMYPTAKLAVPDLCEGTGSSCPAHYLSFASSTTWFTALFEM